MDDKELETAVYNYFDEVPEPNQQILEELKIKMHKRTKSTNKKFHKKLRLALVSCMLVLLIIPAVAISIVWNKSDPSTPTSPSTPPVKEEIYYSDSTLTMIDLMSEELDGILIGEYSKYATLLEDYTINFIRGYYGEDDTLVYLKVDVDKNNIPFTKAELHIVFVENYEHEYSDYFENDAEFIQHNNCKLYEVIYDADFRKIYYKYMEFEDYKVYLQLDKQDSSIINAIVQN